MVFKTAAALVFLLTFGTAFAAPLVPASLWSGLKAPIGALPLESAQLSGIDISDVREINIEAADSIVGEAVRRGSSALELFTEEEFRTQHLYYISSSTVRLLVAKYSVPALTPLAGRSVDGKEIILTAIILGRGRVDNFYNLDRFIFRNDYYPDYLYTAERHVREFIDGPGDLRLEGITANVGFLHPIIKRFLKLPGSRVRTYTNYLNRVKPLLPISLR